MEQLRWRQQCAKGNRINMRHGLKDRHIAALISKINNELHGRYDELPRSTRMTVKLAVEDYLSENQLRLDHGWGDRLLEAVEEKE